MTKRIFLDFCISDPSNTCNLLKSQFGHSLLCLLFTGSLFCFTDRFFIDVSCCHQLGLPCGCLCGILCLELLYWFTLSDSFPDPAQPEAVVTPAWWQGWFLWLHHVFCAGNWKPKWRQKESYAIFIRKFSVIHTLNCMA